MQVGNERKWSEVVEMDKKEASTKLCSRVDAVTIVELFIEGYADDLCQFSPGKGLLQEGDRGVQAAILS